MTRAKHTSLDRRPRVLLTRTAPFGVVQEALVEAFEKLPGYAKERTISFYPWLRQIAWQRLVKLHQRHITASRRTVEREDQAELPLSEDSVLCRHDVVRRERAFEEGD